MSKMKSIREIEMERATEPNFVKVINEVTTYKYKKTPELFKHLEIFYAQK